MQNGRRPASCEIISKQQARGNCYLPLPVLGDAGRWRVTSGTGSVCVCASDPTPVPPDQSVPMEQRTVQSKKQPVLRDILLFRSLPDIALRDFEQHCILRSWGTGEQIVAQDDNSNHVYFVISGKARVAVYSSMGKLVAFRELATGDFFGEFAAFDNKPRSATVETLVPCVTASASPEDFRRLVNENPPLSIDLILHLIAQVRHLTERVYEFSALGVNNRIHAELLRLAQINLNSDGGATIKSAPTHSEIALRVSTHREAVTRELGRLSRKGVVVRNGKNLVVENVGQLSLLVEAKSIDLLFD